MTGRCKGYATAFQRVIHAPPHPHQRTTRFQVNNGLALACRTNTDKPIAKIPKRRSAPAAPALTPIGLQSLPTWDAQIAATSITGSPGSQAGEAMDTIAVMDTPSLTDKGLGNVLGASPAMLTMFELVMRGSPTEATVLLIGESGVG